MSATYTKLRSGDWGVRITGPVAQGDLVSVTKKSGEISWETISKVVWSGNGVSLCAIVPQERNSRTRQRNSGECQCGFGGDMLSMGYSPGQRARCPNCGGWAEAC